MSSTKQLMARKLGGFLEPEQAAELEGKLARDPEAADTFRQLEACWHSLGDVPPGEKAVDLAPELMAAARREADTDLRWSAAPAWARWCGGLALICGSLLGALMGSSEGLRVDPMGGTQPRGGAWEEPLSLSESYWLGIETLTSVSEERLEKSP